MKYDMGQVQKIGGCLILKKRLNPDQVRVTALKNGRKLVTTCRQMDVWEVVNLLIEEADKTPCPLCGK